MDIVLGGSDYNHMFGYYRTTPTGATELVGTGTGIGTGKANTTALVNAMRSTAYTSMTTSITTTTSNDAARLCDNHVVGSYNDWFLPSKDELNLMYLNLKMNGLGGFSGFYTPYWTYWSSSENDERTAYYHNFNDGNQYFGSKHLEYEEFRVRPIRAF